MITITNLSGTEKIEVYGEWDDTPKKWGFVQKTTIYGEEIQEYSGSIINNGVMTITYCDTTNRNKLYDYWINATACIIYDEYGSAYSNRKISEESFGLKPDSDDDGVCYYKGTINWR